ncbi:hypothetical protein F4775DRAFT_538219 [Biscogniauxia sp. FL1348]|nr:hypothetical protein F4775DRAFT_538219 [Biscogniauxia sp. FL1348]
MTQSHNHPNPQEHPTRVLVTTTTQQFITDEDPVTFIHPAAMSGIAGSARGLTSPLGKITEQSSDVGKADAGKAADVSSIPSAPRSMPDTSESNAELSNEGEGEGEMVPAAGRLNEKGEVIDDDGNPIGKVTNGDPSKFAGFIVTQEGEILDDDGEVVGKAEPLEDVASELNYTTKTGKDAPSPSPAPAQEQRGGGGFRGLGNTLWGVGNSAKSVTGLLHRTTKGATGAVGDTTKGVTDTAGDATGTRDVTDKVGDTVKGATDTAGDTAEGVTGAVGDTAKDVTDTAEDTAQGATGATGAAEDTTQGATSAAGDTAQVETGAVDDATQGTTGAAEDATKEVADTVEGTTKDVSVPDTEDVAEDIQDTAEDAAPIDMKDMAEDVTEGQQPGSKADIGSQLGSKEDLGEKMGSEAQLPSKLGSKDDLGSKADNLTEQAPMPIEVPSLSPSIANKVVAMFEGPFTIADGGKVTDQSGKVLGKLAAGSDIQDLIGKQVHGIDGEGNLLGENDTVIGKVDIAPEGSIAQRIKEEVPEVAERLDALEQLEQAKQEAPIQIPAFAPSVADKVIAMFEGPFNISKDGQVTDQNGKILGKLAEGQDFEHLIGKDIKGIDGQGNLLGDNDTVLGKVSLVPEGTIIERIKDEVPEAAPRLDALDAAKQEAAPIQIPAFTPSVADKVIAMYEGPFHVAEDGEVTDQNGKILGKLAEGQDVEPLIGKDIKGVDGQGNLLGDNDTVLGKITLAPEGSIIDRIKEEIPAAAPRLDAIEAAKQQTEELAEGEPQLPDISILEGLKINKMGNVVDENGNPIGRVKSGDLKKLAGKMPDKNGKVWDSRGNVIGEVEVLPEVVPNESAPFEDFPDATVDKFGKVIYDGRQVGVVVGDDFQKLIGKKVDPDGDILDKNGNVIGHAERAESEEPEEPEEEPIDYSMLRDKKVNKLGNVVDDKGMVWGHVVQGVLKLLIGKKVGENGEIFNDAGKVIGKAEPIPESEREDVKEPSPFEDFPDAIVGDDGKVISDGEQVGIVVEGDAKKLKGKSVDADGDILDRAGNLLGRAERWEPEEPEPEPEIDMSALAGKRINKAGNAVDKHGDIYGRVIEGNIQRLVGKMCDKNGFIRNEGGDIIGKCELIPEAEREGMKEGPFTELPGCTVNKEGKVVTPGGDVVGRLVSGDPKVLFGRPVDDDGDICDKNGNVLGHAERWEEPEVPKEVNPMSGRKVNREGNVVDENGDIMGKLTSGVLSQCAGKKIDDDGDVVDQKGSILGHCSLLEEIPEPEPEPEETEEERAARLQQEQDRKIAGQIASCIEQSLDKIKPICKMIVDRIDAEERKPEDERDEEELVKQVRPLIEEGGKILTEANGVIRGLDPDGRIAANAKHKTAAREATPEEYRLADLLKELTGTVTETIENAKRKLEDMPHAKKGINPLWGLLSEPLFQIIAAVGLLLSGVLGLVGKLLNGLGLGGLVNNLLGGLGLTKVLDGLGLGTILAPITGKKK